MRTSGKNKVAIIGAGRLGQTIGYLLQRSLDYQVVALTRRKSNSAHNAARFIGGKVKPYTDILEAAESADIVFITTPDDKIKEVFTRLYQQRAFRKNALVIHCSGNFSSEIFRTKKPFNFKTGSLHPLQTFAGPKEAVRYFKGTICAYESDFPIARKQIVSLIKNLGGIPVHVNKSSKPIYHAAGVIASNYLVTLIYAAREFLTKVGFTSSLAENSILPLVEGTLNNIKRIGFPHALTGPISRGDITTVKNHLEMLKLHLPDYLSFYIILGRHTIKIAQAKKTLSNSKATKFKRLFNKYK
jgi:predicted short-subunit dehydrogenase-like oxidoreductase (DUF2520 family)